MMSVMADGVSWPISPRWKMDSQFNPSAKRLFFALVIQSPQSDSHNDCLADSWVTSSHLYPSPFQSNVIRRMSSLGLPQIRLPSGSRLFWKKKRSAVISDVDPQYRVTYLGNVLTGWAKGESPSPQFVVGSEGQVGMGLRVGSGGYFYHLLRDKAFSGAVLRAGWLVGRTVVLAGDQRGGEPFISRPIFSPLPHFAAFAPAGPSQSQKKGGKEGGKGAPSSFHSFHLFQLVPSPARNHNWITPFRPIFRRDVTLP